MSHAKIPPEFNWPERPWSYSMEDVQALAREAGLASSQDIRDQVGAYATAEWIVTKEMAGKLNEDLLLSADQWAAVIEELRLRHIKCWGSFEN